MGQEVALVAVTLIFGVPIAAFYTYYRVRKLRTEEKLAAIARGVAVPMEAELSQAARSRRSGILLIAGALGFMTTFALLGRTEPDAWNVVSFGAIPLALGMGFFVDSTLVRRELRS
jgi:Domain of unknown function (DUF6249)